MSPFGDRGFESHPLRFFDIDDCRETAEVFSINLLIPQSWGILKAGGYPQTPDRIYDAPLFQRTRRDRKRR